MLMQVVQPAVKKKYTEKSIELRIFITIDFYRVLLRFSIGKLTSLH